MKKGRNDMQPRRVAALVVISLTLASCGADQAPSGQQPASKASSPAPAHQTGSAGSSAAADRTGIELISASWGLTTGDTPEPLQPPTPRIVSVAEGKRQAFEREARKRWKNTEIFVGR
jgi:hypothetical protein